MPQNEENKTKRVLSFRDVLEGRAYIRLPLASKLLLSHWAGAPFAERNPDAYLHPLQVEVMARKEREQIVHGASRLGKSVLGGCRILCSAMIPMRTILVVAGRYDHVDHEYRYFYEAVRRLFKDKLQAWTRLVRKHSIAYHVYEADTVWGTTVRGLSVEADDGASLLGREATDVICGEGSHIKASIRETRIQRAIDGARMNLPPHVEEFGSLFVMTTPKGYEGFAADQVEKVRKEGKGDLTCREYGRVPWPETVYIREANILENPAYDKSVFDAARKNLDEAAFEEQYLGKMVFKTGRVFQEFVESSHCVRMPNYRHLKEMRFFVGIDTGAYFGATLLGIDKNGVLWVLGETYTQKRSIFDSTDEVKAMVVRTLGPPFGCDDWMTLKDRIDRWIVDPASQHKLELIELLNLPTITMPTYSNGPFDVIPTVDFLRQEFHKDKIRIVDGCTWFIDQMRKYIWKQTKTAGSKDPVIREPRKDYDHLIDAFRMGAVPLFETGPYENDPPPITIEDAQKAHNRDRFFGELRRSMNGQQDRTNPFFDF